MEYEIYKTAGGKKRVNIGEQIYLLAPYEQGGNAPRQCMFIRNGGYGPPMQAYANACDDAGVELTYAWDGFMNSLGDHARVETFVYSPEELGVEV